MNDARVEMLRRIRDALRDVPVNPDEEPPIRDYRLSTFDRPSLTRQFAERVAEYRATVRFAKEDALAQTIDEALHARGTRSLVIPSGHPLAFWTPADVTVIRESEDLTSRQLDEADAVLTNCALGIAQTGTIVLDHRAGQARRAISLLPDYHLIVIRENQIVDTVPAAIKRLYAAARARRPLTFISGPSATSDIELNRVEGVHGPRTLDVFIVPETRRTAPSKSSS